MWAKAQLPLPPVTTQCFQTPETARKPSVSKGKKGPLGGFLFSHPPDRPIHLGSVAKTQNKAVK